MFYSLLDGRDAIEVGAPVIVTIAACATARAVHARLLATAAARRRRAAQRLARRRREDADFWLSAAPFAVSKAAALRASMAKLP
jgi:hypothetical protein